MTPFTTVATGYDYTTISFDKVEFLRAQFGQRKTVRRAIPYAAGYWTFTVFPANWSPETGPMGFVDLYVYVSMSIRAEITFTIESESDDSIGLTKTFRCIFGDLYGVRCMGFNRVMSHIEFWPLLVRGEVTFKCEVSFDVPIPSVCLENCVPMWDLEVPPDFTIILGDEHLMVHKDMLRFISPVFRAMLTHDFIEKDRNQVNLIGFDYETVLDVMNFCRGLGLDEDRVPEIIQMLRFADMYQINEAVYHLERQLCPNISPDNFCHVALYAYDCVRIDLLEDCHAHLRLGRARITEREEFGQLPRECIISVIKGAEVDMLPVFVLQIAHELNLFDYVSHLEEIYLNLITAEEFCMVASYAWKCSRDALKAKCVQVFEENTAIITKLPEYAVLDDEILTALIANYDLNYWEDYIFYNSFD